MEARGLEEDHKGWTQADDTLLRGDAAMAFGGPWAWAGQSPRWVGIFSMTAAWSMDEVHLANGVRPEGISEGLLQTVVSSGLPAADHALAVADGVVGDEDRP